jgi:inhibitor of KinA sporulation pathway (predicted exonuclease)
MAKDTKIVNVIDLEATCWDGQPPTGEQSEIIEIGIVEVDLERGDRLSRRSILVQPNTSRVSEFCTTLTGHTQKSIDQNGIPFEAACKILLEDYKLRQRVMVSWGDYDRNMLKRQCRILDIPEPNFRHLNLKTLFSMLVYPATEVGLKTALQMIDLPMNGRHHNGMDDAWNIASILLDLRRAVRVDI